MTPPDLDKFHEGRRLVLLALDSGEIDQLRQVIALKGQGDEGKGIEAGISDALLPAATVGKADMLALLLASGADVTKKGNDKRGAETALQELSWRDTDGHLACAKLLLEAGTDVNAYDGGPLYDAVSQRNTPMVRLLLEHNADTNFHGSESALKNTTDEIRELVSAAADAARPAVRGFQAGTSYAGEVDADKSTRTWTRGESNG